MPDRPHYSAKMKSCVADVMKKGRSESSAYAICTTSLKKAGEAIFESAEAGSEEELKLIAQFPAEELIDEIPRHLHVLGATAGVVRTAEYDGEEYLVVPVIALLGDTVIHAVNASTPEFVPLSTLQVAPQGWNGRPVMLGHPAKDGRQISANYPDVLAERAIGQIFNTKLVGRQLSMEAWINKKKVEKISPKTLERLQNQEMHEVSVGTFVVTENKAGVHNGKAYKAIWKDLVPDHLAFLEDKIGACSIAMGCGAHRAAMLHVLSGDEMQVLAPYEEVPEKEPVVVEVKALDAESVKETVEKIAPEIRAACSCQDKEPEKVVEPVVIPPVVKPLEGAKRMTPEQKAATIKALVEHKHSGYTVGDEKILDVFPDERLESFLVMAEAREKEAKDAAEKKDKVMTQEEFLKIAPPELKSLLSRQQQQENERKAELVALLKTAQQEYPEAELASMKLDELERLNRMMGIETEKPISYAGQAIPRVAVQAGQNNVLEPPDPYAEGVKALRERYTH